jgi:16S rRNA (adenine1518-N6/adenine1519-N6)-dimethyltransferase
MAGETGTNNLPVSSSSASLLKIIKSYGVRLDNRLGQNFLIDESYINKIVDASSIKHNETILEIGAGLGNLTLKIAEYAHRVVAVEIDKRFIPIIQQAISKFNNIELIQGDILELDLGELILGEYKVIANIPYYISSAVIRLLIESKYAPGIMVLTLQQEVAERICEKPGSFSLLALSVQIFGSPEIEFLIPAEAFYPEPEVDSAVISINKHVTPIVHQDLLPLLFRLAKAGFSQRRKTLRNSIAGGMRWSTGLTKKLLISADIEPSRRAETLSIDEWARLSKVIKDSRDIPRN